jgi:hypothetical protein
MLQFAGSTEQFQAPIWKILMLWITRPCDLAKARDQQAHSRVSNEIDTRCCTFCGRYLGFGSDQHYVHISSSVWWNGSLTKSRFVRCRRIRSPFGSSGSRTVIIDRCTEAGGLGLGFNGGELLLLAIGGCFSNDLYREAPKFGVQISSVHIEVVLRVGRRASSCSKRHSLCARQIRCTLDKNS